MDDVPGKNAVASLLCAFDHDLAAKLAALGAPAFACTPDHFPGLMAAAIEKRDVGRWAAEQGIGLERPKDA